MLSTHSSALHNYLNSTGEKQREMVEYFRFSHVLAQSLHNVMATSQAGKLRFTSIILWAHCLAEKECRVRHYMCAFSWVLLVPLPHFSDSPKNSIPRLLQR